MVSLKKTEAENIYSQSLRSLEDECFCQQKFLGQGIWSRGIFDYDFLVPVNNETHHRSKDTNFWHSLFPRSYDTSNTINSKLLLLVLCPRYLVLKMGFFDPRFQSAHSKMSKVYWHLFKRDIEKKRILVPATRVIPLEFE